VAERIITNQEVKALLSVFTTAASKTRSTAAGQYAMILPTLLTFLYVLHVCQASVTVYHQAPMAAQSAAANYKAPAAYDPTVLNAPPIPNPAPSVQFALELQSSGQAVQGLSIVQNGPFLGFSIETSVVNQVREYPLAYLVES
jgi:hypothetical protein